LRDEHTDTHRGSREGTRTTPSQLAIPVVSEGDSRSRTLAVISSERSLAV
jgi:hypothetical protein